MNREADNYSGMNMHAGAHTAPQRDPKIRERFLISISRYFSPMLVAQTFQIINPPDEAFKPHSVPDALKPD